MLNPESSLQSILNPELSQTITTLARQEGQTMLEWVERILREAIQVHSRPHSYENKVSEALKTLERLKQQHAKYLAEHGQPLNIDTVAILNQLRDERDAELLACRHYRRD
jgi:hypothetical protein